jgi:hypothetical protein
VSDSDLDTTERLDPDTLERLDQSNIPAGARATQERIIADGCRQEGLRPVDIFAFTLVGVYRAPDGHGMGTEDHLMGVLPSIGLILFSEKGGLFRARRIDVQTMIFDEAPGLRFLPEDKDYGRSYGSLDLQGYLSGGQPVVRFGWYWSGTDEMTAAARERERIARLLPT